MEKRISQMIRIVLRRTWDEAVSETRVLTSNFRGAKHEDINSYKEERTLYQGSHPFHKRWNVRGLMRFREGHRVHVQNRSIGTLSLTSSNNPFGSLYSPHSTSMRKVNLRDFILELTYTKAGLTIWWRNQKLIGMTLSILELREFVEVTCHVNGRSKIWNRSFPMSL